MVGSTDAGERGGAVGVEMALAWIALLVLIGAVVQVALVFYAGQLALTAAQDGVHAGALQNSGDARAATESFLRRTTGGVLTSTNVTAETTPGGLVRVRVVGNVLSLVPGMNLSVDKSAVSAVERPAP